MRAQLAQLEARVAALRVSHSEEDVHQARVAIRRLRSAIGLFRDYLPESWSDLKEELRWAAGLMGPVRDLDVQMARLAEWGDPDLASVVAALAEERSIAQRAALEGLESERFAQLIRSIRRRLRLAPRADEPAGKALPKILIKRMRKLQRQCRRLKPGAAPEEFHEARILAKRLRYVAEFASIALGPELAAFAKEVAPLQDQLGWRQDAEVAIGRLRALAGARPELAFVCGSAAQRYRDLALVTETAWRGPYRRMRSAYKRLF